MKKPYAQLECKEKFTGLNSSAMLGFGSLKYHIHETLMSTLTMNLRYSTSSAKYSKI